MTNKNDKQQQVMTLRVDSDLLKAFKDIAHANDRTASQLVRDFMRDYIKKHKQIELKL